MFPNDVGILGGWLGFFLLKKSKNRKGKLSLCVCLVESFKLLKGMVQLLYFFIKLNQDKIFFSTSEFLKNHFLIIFKHFFVSTSTLWDLFSHLFICRVTRPVNYIPKITLSNAWIMTFMVTFFPRAGFPLDVELSNRHFRLVNMF